MLNKVVKSRLIGVRCFGRSSNFPPNPLLDLPTLPGKTRDQLTRDERDAVDFAHCQEVQNNSYIGGDPDCNLVAKYMGRSILFKLNTGENSITKPSAREHRIEQLLATRKFMVGIQLHKVP